MNIFERIFCYRYIEELNAARAIIHTMAESLDLYEREVTFLKKESARLRNENWYLRCQLNVSDGDYSCNDWKEE